MDFKGFEVNGLIWRGSSFISEIPKLNRLGMRLNNALENRAVA